MAKKPKFYVVWKGRQPGVYSRWSDCFSQIDGFSGALYKSFSSRHGAEVAWQEGPDQHVARPAARASSSASVVRDIAVLERAGVQLASLSVDAACRGNPGILEYRGVHTATGEEIFRQGPFPQGTVNIGEFLAIVHALAYLDRKGLPWPVYSDSRTALSWVSRGVVNTGLVRTPDNRRLFQLVGRALDWLASHPQHNPVLKWKTDRWGEIGADFGRK